MIITFENSQKRASAVQRRLAIFGGLTLLILGGYAFYSMPKDQAMHYFLGLLGVLVLIAIPIILVSRKLKIPSQVEFTENKIIIQYATKRLPMVMFYNEVDTFWKMKSNYLGIVKMAGASEILPWKDEFIEAIKTQAGRDVQGE